MTRFWMRRRDDGNPGAGAEGASAVGVRDLGERLLAAVIGCACQTDSKDESTKVHQLRNNDMSSSSASKYLGRWVTGVGTRRRKFSCN